MAQYRGADSIHYAHGIGLEASTLINIGTINTGIVSDYFDFDANGSTSGLTGKDGNYLNRYA